MSYFTVICINSYNDAVLFQPLDHLSNPMTSVVMRGRALYSANRSSSNLVPGEDGLWLALSAAGNLDVLARLHRQVPWSICENRRY